LFRPGREPAPGAIVRNQDLTFLKHFTLVIVFLMAVTAVLIFFANIMHSFLPQETSPVAEQKTVERIRPVGQVYAGETGAAAMAAAAEAARAAAASQVAYGGTTDGAVIYNNLCGSCHTAGVAGAPKLDKAAWNARLARGMDTLVRHAVEGYQGEAGLMPARGGNPALTDEQVAASVQWMVDNLK
jgi:cytochrome c5